MLIARDGSSKQRGHGRPPEDFPVPEEVLFPSGSAALYRRTMLEQIGGFDDDFFLYCEDTDLGLRARWAGWKCLYVPEARGGAPLFAFRRAAHLALKAYYVERNRLFVLVKNFPGRHAGRRRLWRRWRATAGTLRYLLQGRGSAARFRAEGNAGPEHAMVRAAGARGAAGEPAAALAPAARKSARGARITPGVFRHLLRGHAISARRVAAL